MGTMVDTCRVIEIILPRVTGAGLYERAFSPAKHCLRCLQDPPARFYLIAAIPDQLQRMTRLADLLAQLPALNLRVIHEVFTMLKVVVHFQSENLMGPKNLGTSTCARELCSGA